MEEGECKKMEGASPRKCESGEAEPTSIYSRLIQKIEVFKKSMLKIMRASWKQLCEEKSTIFVLLQR